MNSITEEKKRQKKTEAQLLMLDILDLIVKIAVIATLAVLLFTFMFGIYRNTSPFMDPSILDGDLVIFYRLDKDYALNDLLVLDYEGKTESYRIVAFEGDEVDIRDGGLYVNGALQSEPRIFRATDQYADGVRFPLTVGKNEVFILGDNRTNSTDSRIFGPVNVSDSKGQVMAVIRRRGF